MSSIFEERKNYKPFEYSFITDPLINAMWKGHWTHNDFNFKSDIQDFKVTMSSEQKEAFRKSLLMISQVEVAVKSYWSNIGRVLPKPEIGDMGAVFGGIEVIHSRAYSEILAKLGFNDDFQSLLSEGIVDNRVKYLTKYVNKIYKNDHKNILYSLVLFTLFTENVSLFSQFYLILAFNRFNNVMRDVANVVQYTFREEDLHAKGGIALINQIVKENPELMDEELTQRIIDEAHEALEAEDQIIDWILGGYSDEYVNELTMKTFLRKRMNESFEAIGISFRFAVDSEVMEKLMWMDEEQYADTMTDFFHKKPTEYQKNGKSFTADELF